VTWSCYVLTVCFETQSVRAASTIVETSGSKQQRSTGTPGVYWYKRSLVVRAATQKTWKKVETGGGKPPHSTGQPVVERSN